MKHLLILFSVCFLFSCKKEPVGFTSKDLSGDGHPQRSAATGIVYIRGNNVYYILSDSTQQQQLTKDQRAGNEISISYDGNSIAYLDIDSVPVIISKKGNLIKKLDAFKSARNIGWMSDNQTLYFIYKNDLAFSGTVTNLPNLKFRMIVPQVHLNSIAVSPDNSVACYYESTSFNYIQYFDIYHLGDTSKAFPDNEVYFNAETEIKWSGKVVSLKFSNDAALHFYGYSDKISLENITSDGGFAMKQDNTEYASISLSDAVSTLSITQPNSYSYSQWGAYYFTILTFPKNEKIIFDWK